jgi:dTDP-4-dehydrorhamnose 3,5-epimerase
MCCEAIEMSRFDFHETTLSGLKLVQRKPIEDARGFFARFYCAEEFRVAGLDKPIAQINHTFTRIKGTVRGLHFQHPPHAETKLVNCLSGAVLDVAVDLRADSLSFLRWHGEILSAENRRSLLIPEGFAHGFQTLTEDCELIYLHTVPFHPEAEGALNVADPTLAIEWPLAVSELSERDRAQPFIGPHFSGIRL